MTGALLGGAAVGHGIASDAAVELQGALSVELAWKNALIASLVSMAAAGDMVSVQHALRPYAERDIRLVHEPIDPNEPRFWRRTPPSDDLWQTNARVADDASSDDSVEWLASGGGGDGYGRTNVASAAAASARARIAGGASRPPAHSGSRAGATAVADDGAAPVTRTVAHAASRYGSKSTTNAQARETAAVRRAKALRHIATTSAASPGGSAEWAARQREPGRLPGGSMDAVRMYTRVKTGSIATEHDARDSVSAQRHLERMARLGAGVPEAPSPLRSTDASAAMTSHGTAATNLVTGARISRRASVSSDSDCERDDAASINIGSTAKEVFMAAMGDRTGTTQAHAQRHTSHSGGSGSTGVGGSTSASASRGRSLRVMFAGVRGSFRGSLRSLGRGVTASRGAEVDAHALAGSVTDLDTRDMMRVKSRRTTRSSLIHAGGYVSDPSDHEELEGDEHDGRDDRGLAGDEFGRGERYDDREGEGDAGSVHSADDVRFSAEDSGRPRSGASAGHRDGQRHTSGHGHAFGRFLSSSRQSSNGPAPPFVVSLRAPRGVGRDGADGGADGDGGDGDDGDGRVGNGGSAVSASSASARHEGRGSLRSQERRRTRSSSGGGGVTGGHVSRRRRVPRHAEPGDGAAWRRKQTPWQRAREGAEAANAASDIATQGDDATASGSSSRESFSDLSDAYADGTM